jgi:hypothetical protein
VDGWTGFRLTSSLFSSNAKMPQAKVNQIFTFKPWERRSRIIYKSNRNIRMKKLINFYFTVGFDSSPLQTVQKTCGFAAATTDR